MACLSFGRGARRCCSPESLAEMHQAGRFAQRCQLSGACGLAWMISGSNGGKTAHWHTGGTNGQNAVLTPGAASWGLALGMHDKWRTKGTRCTSAFNKAVLSEFCRHRHSRSARDCHRFDGRGTGAVCRALSGHNARRLNCELDAGRLLADIRYLRRTFRATEESDRYAAGRSGALRARSIARSRRRPSKEGALTSCAIQRARFAICVLDRA